MNSQTPIVTIDGPAASGKSSVSRELARRKGWKWVSTGAFYRGLALVALKESVAPDDAEGLARLARDPLWHVRLDDDQTRVFWRGDDVTNQILSEENGSRASQVSQIPVVRAALLEGQRACAVGVAGLVAEGRDCGTVVFPHAVLKIFLTASQELRALRRATEQGLNVKETVDRQRERDHQDANRTAAPMQIPPSAHVVDSNGLSLNQVVDQVFQLTQSALAQGVKSF